MRQMLTLAISNNLLTGDIVFTAIIVIIGICIFLGALLTSESGSGSTRRNQQSPLRTATPLPKTKDIDNQPKAEQPSQSTPQSYKDHKSKNTGSGGVDW